MIEIKEIEKTFIGVDSALGLLLQEASEYWKKNSNSDDEQVKQKSKQTKENIEKRLNHLFDKSQPALNEEEKLSYSFYELKEMLTKVVSKLPDLFDEKDEIDEKLLTLLTNVSTAFKELENEKEEDEEEERIIPTSEDFYELLKKMESDETDSEIDSDEVEWLENELEKEKLKNDRLRQELISLKAAEEDRNNQLRQLKEKEQQTRNEIDVELSLITLFLAFPSEIADEQLVNFLARLREMKSWLISGTDEQQKVIRDEYNHLKEVLELLKLEERRRSTKQRIADILADEEVVVIEAQELPDWKKWKEVEEREQELSKWRYRNYSWTLDEMYSSTEIIEFEKEILWVIAEQRQAYQTIIEVLSQGEEAIKRKNLRQAEKVRKYLLEYGKSQPLLKKTGDFHVLISRLNSFIREQKIVAVQVAQPSK